MQLCECVCVFGVSARASAKKEQLLREELLLLFVQADKEADKKMQIVLFVLLLRDKLCANWATPWAFFPLSFSLPLSASLSDTCFLSLSLI